MWCILAPGSPLATTWYIDAVETGDAESCSVVPETESLAAAAVSRGRMIDGSLKKSSSLPIFELKPVLKSRCIRFLIILEGCFVSVREREKYKTKPSRYAAIDFMQSAWCAH